jgi:hypothetical protein
MAKQTQEIAEAVLFWLEGTEGEPATDIICEPEFELLPLGRLSRFLAKLLVMSNMALFRDGRVLVVRCLAV